MIRILDRLVMWTFTRIFVGFVLGAPLLFLLGDFIDRSDSYFDDGLTFAEIMLAYVFKMPQFIVWSFPIAALVAAVFTIHGMTVHREILAAKAGGVSFRRVVAPILFLGVVLTGVGSWLTELVPLAERRANQILGRDLTGQQWRSYFVYKSGDGGTLSATRLTVADGRMLGITLALPARADSVTEYIHAEDAFFSEESGWTFRNGYHRRVLPGNRDVTTTFDSLRTRRFAEPPRALLEETHQEEEMTAAELDRLATNIERSGGDANGLRLERAQRNAIAVATLVIVLFGAPLATSSRRGGNAFGIGIALGTTILYMLVLRVTGALGETGALEPQISAWLPNAVFGICGLILFRRVRT